MMKKIGAEWIKFLGVALAAAVITTQITGAPGQASGAAMETGATQTAFDRVMKTGTLRCSYVAYDPANIVDPNTGEMSGILHDIAEAMGRQLDIKIEWVAESTWATFMEDIRTGRADAFCGAAFGFAPELKYGEQVGPFYYSPITLWTRTDDTRFDNNVAALNHENVTVVGEDGSIASKLSGDVFPKAKMLGLPHNAPYSMKLDNVTDGKGDATLVETSVGLDYIAHNPGTLKNVTPNEPVAVYPNLFVVAKGEFKLQSMLQGAANILHNNGTVERIMKKYEKHPGALLRVAKGYTAE